MTDRQFKYLSDDDIEMLLEIKNDNNFVFFANEFIKDLVEDTPQFWMDMTAPVANEANAEIARLVKALTNQSDGARRAVNQAFSGDSYVFGNKPDMVPYLINRLGKVDLKKSLTKRLQLGDDALYQFKMFKLKATTYEDGAFVKYLGIILSASKLSYCAVTLARDTLKRY